MLHAAHPVHPVHRDRCTSPCTATTRTHATRLSIACCGGGASHYLSLVALVLISANAGLTIAIVTKTVGTHTQKHVYAVSLTSRLNSAGESVVAKVPCVEVAEAIVSIQNGDADQGLVMIPLGNDDLSVRRSLRRVVQRVVRDLDGGLRDPPRPPLRRSALGGHRFER
jgi:hypothetical protein